MSEEDTELRDLIIDSLEKKGVLAKIKAELRASVFLALEETENEKYKIPLSNEAIQKFQETKDGRTSLSLVRDFLEFFHLDYTLAVLDTEISPFKAIIKKRDLEKDLNLTSNTDVPLVTLILRERAAASSNLQQTNYDVPVSKNDSWKSSMNSKPENNTFLINKNRSDENSAADDPFFDDPISVGKEPLLISLTGSSRNDDKTAVSRSSTHRLEERSGMNSSEQHSDEDVLSDLHKRISKTKTQAAEPTVLHASSTSLSSLKDLPSLTGNVRSKEEGRVHWLEHFDTILHAALHNNGPDEYEDDFQSSESGKSGSKHDGQRNGNNLKDNTDGSIDEDIEEDISIPADDLLNASLGEDNDATSDRTISHLSSAGGFDYMEKLS